MADSFKKARELSRLAKLKASENGEQSQLFEEKERAPMKRVVEGGENDENFIRASVKRPFEDGGVENDSASLQSGIRPPSKRMVGEDDDRAVSRWELAKLQASWKQLQEQSERWKLEADQQRALMESQAAAHAKQVSILESQIKAHSNSVKPTTPKTDNGAVHELRAEITEKRRQLSASQQEVEELRANERKLRHQYDSLVEANIALESSQRAQQQQLADLEAQMSNNRVDKHSTHEYKIMLDEMTRKCKDLELQLAAKTNDKLSDKSSQDFSNTLREKEREIRQLTSENQRMKAKVRACETVEDELAELRSKEARNEKMREELAQAQSENITLKQKEEDWVSTLARFFPSEDQSGLKGGPRDILALIESLQNSCQMQKAEQGQLITLNKQLELRLQHQQERSTTLEVKVKETEAQLEQTRISLERSRMELSRAVKDKEMYKGFLDSYEAEDKTFKHDEARAHRIEELENSLLAAQTRANEKETAAQVLEMQNRQLEQHLKQVEAEAAKMSEALGRGEFNAQNTKVLHMTMNPAKKAVEAKIEQLKAENEILKQQLAESNNGVVVKADTVALAEKDKEIEKLKMTVSDLEISRERCIQVFRGKVKEFRESCYLLTGYKIEMKQISGHNGFLLRSMYAEQEADFLEFFDTGTKLEVMETDYCKRLDKQILECLEKFNSIPAFLSEITLDLFNKQTRM